MNVYIVDDRPQTLLSLVAQMVKNGFHVQTVFVYFERKEDADNRKVKTLENHLRALGVTLRTLRITIFIPFWMKYTWILMLYFYLILICLLRDPSIAMNGLMCSMLWENYSWNRTISKSGSIPQAPFPWLHKYIICLVIGLFRWNDLIQ